jgi:hypothetical protein
MGNANHREPCLFINYRSEDTGPTASRLYEELVREFGLAQVFLDHKQIEAGANWPDALRGAVKNATVMFVLIGDRWLTAHDAHTGDRRLNLPDDWVRQEIETAIEAETAIVPILVEEVSPLNEQALRTVPTIRALHGLQALPLRRKDWERDLARIAEYLVTAGFSRSTDNVDNRVDQLVELVFDRVAPYRMIQAGRPTMYGTIKMPNGSNAFGEGVSLQLTLENRSKVEVVVTRVDVVVEEYDPSPPSNFEYSAFWNSSPRLEVPGSTRTDPLELTERLASGSFVPVTNRRLFLRPTKDVESQHTLNFSLVAKAAGLWTVKVRADFVDAARLTDPRFVESGAICIVKN